MNKLLNNFLVKNNGLLQFIKFGLVGVLNTAVDWIVFFLFTSFVITAKDSEPLVKAIAFFIAMLNSYLWNTIWTFKKEYKSAAGTGVKKKGSYIFFKFMVVSLTGWVINVFTFQFVRFNLDQGQIIALVAASAMATFLNFFANKYWTYKK